MKHKMMFNIIIDKVELIHSVDSIRLLEAIDKEAAKKDIIANVLIEVNVAKEDTKFGLMPEEVEEFIEESAKFNHVCIKGLMTIAPFVDDPEENRVHFKHLHKLSVDIKAKNKDNSNDIDCLSMGMSSDYLTAVKCGSTLVRIGSSLFGTRKP